LDALRLSVCVVLIVPVRMSPFCECSPRAVSVSPNSSVSQKGMSSLMVPPDTEALRLAGASCGELISLWESYYDACYRAVSGAHASPARSSAGCAGVVRTCGVTGASQDARVIFPPTVESEVGRDSLPKAFGGSSFRSAASDPSRAGSVSVSLWSDGSSAGGVSVGNDIAKGRNGYGYVNLLRSAAADHIKTRLGPEPSLRRVLAAGPSAFLPWDELSRCRWRIEDGCAVYVGWESGGVGLVAFTTLVKAVPVAELRKSWHQLVSAESRCEVPGVHLASFRLCG